MFKRIAVGDIMTRHFVSVGPRTNLLECARELVKQKVNGLVVTEGKKLLGIITQHDILWAITKKPGLDLRRVRVMDVATKKVAVIKPSADITQAFQKMRKYRFRRLPVMSRGEIVGLLTLKDILAIEPAFYTKSGELLEIKEAAEKMKKAAQEEPATDGMCEECGSYSELLKVEDRFLCPGCRDELY